MSANIFEHTAFVNEQIVFHRERAEQFKGQSRARKHLETKEKLESLADFIESAASDSISNTEGPKQLSLSLKPQDIEGLPDELLEELSIAKDKTEFLIFNAIEENGGAASIDQILISLYRATGEVTKRNNLNNRLYRMAAKGELHSVPEKKGVYSLELLAPGEIDKLLLGKGSSEES